MGDHRADIKITMTAHGKKYEKEWWINWSPNDDGCDQRVVDWFCECWEDAYNRYDEARYLADSENRRIAEEQAERAELARLKSKYEP